MREGEYKTPEFMALYERFQSLDRGRQAEIKRVANPSDLIEIPAFYRVLQNQPATRGMQRLLFCLPLIKHQDKGDSLGKALAKADINEKRMFMVIRSQEPNGLIQLRRLLQQADKPPVDWLQMATDLWWWDHSAQRSKRKVLEDFFFYQNSKATA